MNIRHRIACPPVIHRGLLIPLSAICLRLQVCHGGGFYDAEKADVLGQFFQRNLELRVALPHRLDHFVGVQHGAVIAPAEVAADLLERERRQRPGQVHADLPREARWTRPLPRLEVRPAGHYTAVVTTRKMSSTVTRRPRAWRFGPAAPRAPGRARSAASGASRSRRPS